MLRYTVRPLILSGSFLFCLVSVSMIARIAPGQANDIGKPAANSNSNKVPSFADLWNALPKGDVKVENVDDSGHSSMKSLRSDYRMADVVAHVDIRAAKLVGRAEGSECDNEQSRGYCSYLLTGVVRESFKGQPGTGTVEYNIITDGGYPKKHLLGERIVFLAWQESSDGRKRTLGSLENSSRGLEPGVLQRMRVIADPTASIDENDENEPYSVTSVKASFDEAEVVAYVEALSFRPDRDQESEETAEIIKAVVKEVFKGDLKPGQTIEYRENLVHRQHRKEDLGAQVLYLSRPNDRRFERMKYDKDNKPYFEKIPLKEKVIYENELYGEAFIKHNILEKLRRISKGN